MPGLVPTEFGATAGIDEGGWDQFPGFIKTTPEDNAEAAIEGMEKGKRVGRARRVQPRVGDCPATTRRARVLLGVMRRFYPVGS